MGLTVEEHKARATLMGYRLNRAGGYYWQFGSATYPKRLDANTLEPLTDEGEIIKRQRYKHGDYKYD